MSQQFNPYPGLRAFEPDEDYLFFGREKEIDELLERLRHTRVLSVIGGSGSGKSSLVRSGLIPALQGGFMVEAGSSWRVAILRPGEDPIGNLARCLDAPEVLGAAADLAETNRTMLEATLRSSALGLVEAVHCACLPADDNVLVVVDQFEELFRFKQSRTIGNAAEDATAFVKLLLEATKQEQAPVYILITMRSDFIGDCMVFAGLPEAISAGQYLIPRMTREQLRAAITGPAAVGGAPIASRLVVRLLNEVGDDPDQLPVLQHALMRTWDYWTQHHTQNEPLDLHHYEAIGTMSASLSQHAEEAFQELSDHEKIIAAKLFKALTDTTEDKRGVRRPTPVRNICTACEAHEEEIFAVVERFRQPGRTFLMPPAFTPRPVLGLLDFTPEGREQRQEERASETRIPLTLDTILDISHESLIRQWDRLKQWEKEEAQSVELYQRLRQTATLWKQGEAGLWGTPDLDVALHWRAQEQPTVVWTERYGGGYTLAMEFLEASEQNRRANQQAARRRRQRIRIGFMTGFLIVLVLMLISLRGWQQAAREKQLANFDDLIAQTTAAGERHPQRSLLLAAEALQLTEQRGGPSLEDAKQIILQTLTNTGGVSLLGHTERINTIALSPDGRWLATGSDDRSVKLWDVSAAIHQHQNLTAITLAGHKSPVRTLAITPDSHWLATGGNDSEVLLWDLTAPNPGAEPESLKGHEGAIVTLASTPDGHWLVTGSDDHTVRLWDLTAANPSSNSKRLLGHDSTISALIISPDSHWLITGSEDQTACLWDLTAPQTQLDCPHRLSGHTGPVSALTVSPDGHWLVTSSDDHTARLWDLLSISQTETALHLLQGHTGRITSMAVSPDSRWLATGSEDRTARLWDLTAPESPDRQFVLRGHKDAILTTLITPDGHWLVTGSQDNSVRLWDLTTIPQPGALSLALRGHDGRVTALAVSSDSRWLFTSSRDSTVRLWDLLAPLAPDLPLSLSGHSAAVTSLSISPDGQWLATGSDDHTARLWNLDEPIGMMPPSTIVLQGHNSSVRAVAFSRDGHWLATGGERGTARLWNLRDPNLASNHTALPSTTGPIRTLTFSPDSTKLVTGSEGNTASIWDITAPTPTEQPVILSGHGGPVRVVVFSPDGHWLVTGGRDSIARLWNLGATSSTTERYERYERYEHYLLAGHTDAITTAAFSPDSRWLATGSEDNTVRLWEVTAQNPAAHSIVLSDHTGLIRAVAFSPDSHWLASGSEDSTARLWDMNTLKPLAPHSIVFKGHEHPIRTLAFSPDGLWLATGGDDNLIRLWDLRAPSSDAKSTVLAGHADPVTALAFSPDGRLVSGSEDSTVRVWRLFWLSPSEREEKRKLLDVVCRIADRPLNELERIRYAPGIDQVSGCQ